MKKYLILLFSMLAINSMAAGLVNGTLSAGSPVISSAIVAQAGAAMVASNNMFTATNEFDGTNIFADIFISPYNRGSNGTNGTISFGMNFGRTAILLYDGGAGVRYGWGLNASEMQFYVLTGAHFSWNGNGDLQPSGSNEYMRLDTATGNLSLKNGSYTGNGSALTNLIVPLSTTLIVTNGTVYTNVNHTAWLVGNFDLTTTAGASAQITFNYTNSDGVPHVVRAEAPLGVANVAAQPFCIMLGSNAMFSTTAVTGTALCTNVVWNR